MHKFSSRMVQMSQLCRWPFRMHTKAKNPPNVDELRRDVGAETLFTRRRGTSMWGTVVKQDAGLW
jgi:hypothetical protein